MRAAKIAALVAVAILALTYSVRAGIEEIRSLTPGPAPHIGYQPIQETSPNRWCFPVDGGQGHPCPHRRG